MEFGLIKECIKYAEKKSEGKDLSFSLTTNGTIITEEILEYFIKNKVQLMISLDGPKEIHDRNRRFAANNEGTFDTVYKNVMHIKCKYPEYAKRIMFNMVMDPDVDFNCINQFVAGHQALDDSYVRTSLVNDIYSQNSDTFEVNDQFRILRGYELFKVFLAKLKMLDEKYISRIVDIEYFNLKEKMVEKHSISKELPLKGHHSGPCVPGLARLFMNADGDFYPCERVSEESEVMKIGNIERGFDIYKIKKLLNIGKLTEEDCRNCWAFRYCNMCAMYADDLTFLNPDKKRRYCSSQKYTAENMFKNYCTLKEFGHDFYDEDYKKKMEIYEEA